MTNPATPSPVPIPSPIAELLGRLALAPRQTHKALTLWPLVLREDAPRPVGPEYVPIARALEDGSVQIDELSEHGSVPLVRVRNRGIHDVLLLFGEEIRGAKQNRIANASFLVPARSDLEIDVSCVEQGRWGRRGQAGFAASREVASQGMRRMMSRSVSESLRRGGRFHANQGEVWEEIGARLSQSGTTSATDSYEDYVRSRRADLAELLAAFRPLDRQVGFLALIGDEIVGLEAIGRPEVFAEQFESLVRSYAVDAIDPPLGARDRGRRTAGSDSPEAFLAALSRAPAQRTPSLGLGDDLRIEGEGVTGCALVAGQVIHLTAFPSLAAAHAPGEG